MSTRKIYFITLFSFFLNFFSYASFAALNPIDDWQFYFKRGVIQFNNNMTHESIDSFELSLSMNRKNFRTLNYLGKLYLKKNDRDRALEYFLESIKLKKNQPDIHHEAARIYRYFTDYKRALHHYEASIIKEKNTPQREAEYSILLRISGNTKKSVELLKKIRTTNIEKSRRLLNESREKKYITSPERISILKKAIETNPAHMELYTELSGVYRARRDYNAAVKILEIGKSIDPAYRLFYIHLGNLYFNRKISGNTRAWFLKLSEKNLRKAVELDRSDTETLIQLTRLLRFQGRIAEAEEIEKKIQ